MNRVHRIVSPLAVAVAAVPLFAQTTERASIGPGAVQAVGTSKSASVSLDGRRVAFMSSAANLGATDNNGTYDVFVRDRVAGTTVLVSATASSSTTTAAGTSSQPAISSDGRYVAFLSNASDLVSPVPPGTGSTVVWLRDLQTSQTMLVSRDVADNAAYTTGTQISISANGRYVVYESSIDDIVPDDYNHHVDVYVFDRTIASTERVSTTAAGVEADADSTSPAISPDGRYVAFVSAALSLDPAANGSAQIYLKDRTTNSLTLVSRNTQGAVSDNVCATPRVSAGGKCVAFLGYGSNLVPNGPFVPSIYLRDLAASKTERVSVNDLGAGADNSSYAPSISADGRFVAFQSAGSNLDIGASGSAYQVFLRDRDKHTTRTVSVNTAGQFATPSGAIGPAISGDGRFVAFESDATNLIASDTNAATDVFLRDRRTAAPWKFGVAQHNSLGCTPAIGSTGSPSATAASGFTITCSSVLNNKTGLLFYSTTGAAAVPFLGGFLYCKAPTMRTPARNSFGSASGSDCTGHFGIDFNAWIHAGSDPALVNGREVWAQWWSRDPAAASTTNLSDAITFVIGP